MLVIQVSCNSCGVLAKRGHWSVAVAEGATHEHQPVRVVGVLTRAEWARVHADYKTSRRGEHAVLHRDSDGNTILIPVEVR